MAKNNNGKWFAILVIVLFLSSTFSVFLYTSGNKEDTNTTTTTVTDPTTTIPISYTATLDGNILEVPTASSFRLMAYTNETDVDKLDLSLRDVNGVYNVAGSITLNKDTNKITANYIYIADIVGTSLDYNFLYGKINDNNSFIKGQTNLFPYAKVSYNSLVDFTNKDLNSKKQYDLGGNEIVVLVEPDTFVNDKISFSIAAQFKGDALANYGAFELQNLSAQPQAINSIYSSKFTNSFYAISFDGNIAKDKFKVLNDKNLDYNYEFSYSTTYLTIDKDANLSKYLTLLNGFSKDYNAKENSFVYGTIFVDTISYMDKNYDANRLVNTFLDYNKYIDLNSNLEYNLTAYLVRDKIVSVSANPIFDVNKVN